MRIVNRQVSFVLVSVLLVGMMALPVAAQETTDYPPLVDGEVVESDNEVDSGAEVDVGEVVTTSDDNDVEAAALAQTGGEITFLLLAALLLVGLGGAALMMGRRRRTAAGSS